MTTGTVVYVIKGAHVLLARLKTGIGSGQWNGLGGNIEIGENATMAAVRNVKVLTGVTLALNDPASEILYHDSARNNWKVTIWRADDFQGEIAGAGQTQLQWWPVDDLPFKEMEPGDGEWLPLLIEGKAFSAEIWFNDK